MLFFNSEADRSSNFAFLIRSPKSLPNNHSSVHASSIVALNLVFKPNPTKILRDCDSIKCRSATDLETSTTISSNWRVTFVC